MKIPFSSLSLVDYPFKLNLENVVFEGFITKVNPKLAKIRASMKGFAYRVCDRCGAEKELELDEQIEVLASDGIFKDEPHTLSNVIEFFDSQIDMIELAVSEFEAVLSDYFYCENCKEN